MHERVFAFVAVLAYLQSCSAFAVAPLLSHTALRADMFPRACALRCARPGLQVLLSTGAFFKIARFLPYLSPATG